MKEKKNNGKYKFPIDIKGELLLPDLVIPDPFDEIINIKKKISSEVLNVNKKDKKDKKCKSNKLI